MRGLARRPARWNTSAVSCASSDRRSPARAASAASSPSESSAANTALRLVAERRLVHEILVDVGESERQQRPRPEFASLDAPQNLLEALTTDGGRVGRQALPVVDQCMRDGRHGQTSRPRAGRCRPDRGSNERRTTGGRLQTKNPPRHDTSAGGFRKLLPASLPSGRIRAAWRVPPCPGRQVGGAWAPFVMLGASIAASAPGPATGAAVPQPPNHVRSSQSVGRNTNSTKPTNSSGTKIQPGQRTRCAPKP